MNLILESNNGHVSLDAVKEFEKAIVDAKLLNLTKRKKPIIDFFFKIFKRLYIDAFIIRILKPFYKSKSDNFTILMGPHFSKCFPYMLSNGNNGLYLYDAWPKDYNYISKMIIIFNLKFIYFSSKRTAELYSHMFKGIEIKWIPEAICLDEYKFMDYNNKDIDVLQFGRKYDFYHNAIVENLQILKINYMYEKVKGEVVFQNRQDFISGLARTKISICVPSSITHKERSGDISSVTLRYWQSMASKCLILGVMPEEMKYIFNYTPIVIIDLKNPVAQIESILKNFETYIPLIEANYQNVVKFHTWSERLKLMNHLF